MTSQQYFPVGRPTLDIRSPALESNKAKWKVILDDFRERLNDIASEGTDASCSRHQSRGQLLREWFATSFPTHVGRLFDNNMPVNR